MRCVPKTYSGPIRPPQRVDQPQMSAAGLLSTKKTTAATQIAIAYGMATISSSPSSVTATPLPAFISSSSLSMVFFVTFIC